MKWREVNHTHNGSKATVRTPKGLWFSRQETYIGIIRCGEGKLPCLQVGKELHAFAWWYNVELEQKETEK